MILLDSGQNLKYSACFAMKKWQIQNRMLGCLHISKLLVSRKLQREIELRKTTIAGKHFRGQVYSLEWKKMMYEFLSRWKEVVVDRKDEKFQEKSNVCFYRRNR